MNLKFYLIFIFLFILAFTAGYSLAATRISQQSGDWSSSATWGGVIPAANDDIIVSAGTIVRLNTSLSSSLSYHNLDIESGGSLIVGIDKVTLRLAGNLRNNGILNLWQSSTLQGDIVLYANSFWSGNGTWNLSTINVQSN